MALKKRYVVWVPERLQAFQGREEVVDRALQAHGGRVADQIVFACNAVHAGVTVACRLEAALGLPDHSISAKSFAAQLLRRNGRVVIGQARPPKRKPRSRVPTVQLLLPGILKPAGHCTA